MTAFQRIFFRLVALMTFANGTSMVLRWAQDTSAHKGSFILVIGIVGILVGLFGFFFSLKKFDKKEN